MSRLEIWFSNGLFRAFPKVDDESKIEKDGYLYFAFGKSGTHTACVNLKQVNFMENCPDIEE